MLQVAGRLSEAGRLGFSEHWTIITSALDEGEWQLAREYVKRAAAMASPDSFKADYAGYDLSEEDVARGSGNRTGMLLVADGWARANTGEIDEALLDFSRAEQLVRRTYFGVPDYGLDLYWGKALTKKGEYDEAIDKLATRALILQDDAARAELEKAYTGKHGSRTGFIEFSAALRVDVAKKIGDVDLLMYDGGRRRLRQLLGDLTLLSFWFPSCAPCRVELPRLERLWRSHRDDGVVVIAVEVMGERERAEQFIADNDLTFKFAEVSADNPFIEEFGIREFPTSVLIDGDGRILWYKTGFEAGDEIELEKEILDLGGRAACSTRS
jgi:thiol-disulfide isomerase/thioredoxin